jgi:hypothetical protein
MNNNNKIIVGPSIPDSSKGKGQRKYSLYSSTLGLVVRLTVMKPWRRPRPAQGCGARKAEEQEAEGAGTVIITAGPMSELPLQYGTHLAQKVAVHEPGSEPCPLAEIKARVRAPTGTNSSSRYACRLSSRM